MSLRMRPMSPSSTWSEKPETESAGPKPLSKMAPERMRGRIGKSAAESRTETRLAIKVVRISPALRTRCAAAGSPASIASARSVWMISVHTAATVNATRSGGKKALSVRLAAIVTWKTARATSRNSDFRGRASRS